MKTLQRFFPRAAASLLALLSLAAVASAQPPPVKVRLPQLAGRFARKAELMIDDQGFSTVRLAVTGWIAKAVENEERVQGE